MRKRERERPAGEVIAESPVVHFHIAPSEHRRRADLEIGDRAWVWFWG